MKNNVNRLQNERNQLIIATNWMDYNQLRPLITAALETGYRAFDTARDYGNEAIVGKAIQDSLKDTGVDRSEIFITTKIGNSQQIKGNISEQIDMSLKNLCTDYVDMWLMHWPYPNYYISNWEKMEAVYNSGKATGIGIANCAIRHYKEFFNSDYKIKPTAVQFELHPMRTATDIVDLCNSNNIHIQAYSPLCRFIDPIKNSDIIKQIANTHSKTMWQIILRWHIQQGFSPVFKTLNPNRLKENFQIFDFVLSEDEIKAISSLNCDYKYHLESASCPGY